MKITVRQLEAFLSVARLSSFHAAATELCVTPSALSAIIRDAERATGLRLFDRSTRHVRLSEAGQEFRPHAARALQELANAEQCAADLRGLRRGSVRVAGTQVMFWTMLPPLFAAFRRRHPGISLLPVEGPVDRVLDALVDGRADVAFFAERRDLAGFESHHLFDTSTHLVVPRRDPLARRRRIAWSELSAAPLIFVGAGACARTRAALGYRHAFTNVTEVLAGTTAFGLVGAGLGYALVLGLIAPVAAGMGLRLVPVADPVLSRRMMLHVRTDRPASSVIDAFARFAIDHFSIGPPAVAGGPAAGRRHARVTRS